jgi:hypothetical protein
MFQITLSLSGQRWCSTRFEAHACLIGQGQPSPCSCYAWRRSSAIFKGRMELSDGKAVVTGILDVETGANLFSLYIIRAGAGRSA